MKDPAALIFFLIIIIGVIFEKIAKFKNAQKHHSSKKAVSQESAEEFFRRVKSDPQSLKPRQQEITYAPEETEVQPLAEVAPDIHTNVPDTPKKRSKKTVLNLKDKQTLKKAYVLKTILDRPQSYKF